MREISRTYVAQVGDNLPHPRLVQPGEIASVLPEEVSKVTKLAQLRLDVQSLILFPAVDIRQYVRVSCHRMCIRQMLENLDLLAQSKSSKKAKLVALIVNKVTTQHGHMNTCHERKT